MFKVLVFAMLSSASGWGLPKDDPLSSNDTGGVDGARDQRQLQNRGGGKGGGYGGGKGDGGGNGPVSHPICGLYRVSAHSVSPPSSPRTDLHWGYDGGKLPVRYVRCRGHFHCHVPEDYRPPESAVHSGARQNSASTLHRRRFRGVPFHSEATACRGLHRQPRDPMVPESELLSGRTQHTGLHTKLRQQLVCLPAPRLHVLSTCA